MVRKTLLRVDGKKVQGARGQESEKANHDDELAKRTLANAATSRFAVATAGGRCAVVGTRCRDTVTSGLVLVGQIEDGGTVATVHNGNQGGSFRHGRYQSRVQIVVANLSGTGVVDRHQGFVVAVIFVTVVVFDVASVACKENKRKP